MTRIKLYITIAILLSFSQFSYAQKDSSKQTVNITTAFKPVLRNAVKINLSGSQISADSASNLRPYVIPSQNLFYAYQPIALRALALEQDTNLYLGGRNYVKAGFGNLSTPYAEAGLSFGNGRTALVNLYGRYIASKGKIEHQNYGLFDGKAAGSYFTNKLEIAAAVSMFQHQYRLYGYDHSLYQYDKKDVRQLLSDLNIKAGVRNIKVNDFNLSYNPSIEIDIFSNRQKLDETGFKLILPIEKRFGNNFSLKLSGSADLTNYTIQGLVGFDTTFGNNVYQVKPDLVYNSERLNINVGVAPTWHNKDLKVLPNVYAEAQIKEKVFMVQAGWVGRYVKNTYHQLSDINPYLDRLFGQTNTIETEYYGGIKTNLGKHFKLNAKVGVVHYENLALFVNDTAYDSKAFKVVYEPTANNFRIAGDISYIANEKFSANARVTFNGYTGLNTNARAWGALPVELNSALRWWAFRQVLLKADFWFFGGNYYMDKGNIAARSKPGADFSAGAEFKINKQISAWLDVNNIFNNNYERWHRYEVYGLNLLGGIRFNF